mgnify:CR=1 FL=1
MADGSIKIDTRIKKDKAEQDLNNLKRTVDARVRQITEELNKSSKEIENFNSKFNDTSSELASVEAQMDAIGDRIFETFKDFQNVTPEAQFDKFIQSQIEADAEYQKLSARQTELTGKVETYKNKLQESKSKHQELTGSLEVEKQKQEDVNNKIEKAKMKAKELGDKMKTASQHAKKVSTNSLGIASGIGKGITKLAKYALTLMGISTIYNFLRSAMNEWLNSSDASAKQLKADLDNIKTSIGATLAPALQGLLSIFYKILAVVGAIVKAFSNINIFSKSTAKSSGATAKNTSNQLANFDEMNKLQDNSSGGGGDGSVTPTDLSAMMAQYEELANKIKHIFEVIFEPFKKAWETEGQGVIDSMYHAFEGMSKLGEAVGNSIIKVWTNGTVQKSIELWLQLLEAIFNIIGNIGEAFANAWNKDNMGDEIIQGLVDAFINLQEIVVGFFQAIAEWTSTESFQVFADTMISIISTLVGWFEKLTEMIKNVWNNGGKETFTKLLDAFSKLFEFIGLIISILSPIVEWLISFLEPVIQGIIDIIGYVADALGGLIDFIIGVFTGDWERAWNGIKDFFIGIWNAIKTLVTTVWNAICTAITTIIEQIKIIITTVFTAIKDIVSNIWNGIKNFISSIWEGIKTTITNVVTNIYNGVVNKFTSLKNSIVSIFEGIKTAVSNVWNGIWNVIKNIANSILGGIEALVNGIINGLNKMIGAMNKLSFDVPDWVPGLGR